MLLDELIEIGGSVAPSTAEPVILSDRHGVLAVRVGEVVVKAHRPGTTEADLRVRLGVAAEPALEEILLPPMGGLRRAGDRLVTVWPAGRTVPAADVDDAPWEQGAHLLARLHAVPVLTLPDALRAALPAAGGPARVTRTVARLPDRHPAAAPIRRAYATLPPWIRDKPPGTRPGARRATERGGVAEDGGASPHSGVPAHSGVSAHSGGLVHGDWHLGQLVCTPGASWRLIDVDDLGAGDPVWDLARPAALYAAGLLPPPVWARFLLAYRLAGGCAVPADGDPWRCLNVPAQALAIQIAATCVIAAYEEDRQLDESETALVAACRRIAATRNPT